MEDCAMSGKNEIPTKLYFYGNRLTAIFSQRPSICSLSACFYKCSLKLLAYWLHSDTGKGT